MYASVLRLITIVVLQNNTKFKKAVCHLQDWLGYSHTNSPLYSSSSILDGFPLKSILHLIKKHKDVAVQCSLRALWC